MVAKPRQSADHDFFAIRKNHVGGLIGQYRLTDFLHLVLRCRGEVHFCRFFRLKSEKILLAKKMDKLRNFFAIRKNFCHARFRMGMNGVNFW